MKPRIFLLSLLLATLLPATASDITEIRVVHHRLVAIRFLDGHIRYHGYHEDAGADSVTLHSLDVREASYPVSYTIRPAKDKKQKPVHPLRVSRKTKAHGVSMKNLPGAPNTQLQSQYAPEHWIFLELPFNLQPNQEYVIETGRLAANGTSHRFLFDPFSNRSAAIHTNTVGFRPTSAFKKGYLSLWMGDGGPLSLDEFAGTPFHICPVGDDTPVFSGTIRQQKDFFLDGRDGPVSQSPNGNYVATDVWECDFSPLTTPGTYRLVVENFGCSESFTINADVYRNVFRTVTRGLYHQRSGIELKEPYTQWTRPAPHRPGVTPGFELKYSHFRHADAHAENAPADKLTALIDETVDASNMWGWYQDAGDWDAYSSHAVVPAFLLTTFELKPRNFADGELNIPESGNGIPDIMDEAAWLLHHYHRTKGPTGGNAGARIEGDFLPGDEAGRGRPSYEDRRPYWVVYGEEPGLTYTYARLSAQYANAFRVAAANGLLGQQINAADSIAFWTNEALTAYRWAENNQRPGDEPHLRKWKADAAAWIYKLTADNSHFIVFRDNFELPPPALVGYSAYPWGVWALSTLPTDRQAADPEFFARIRQLTVDYGRTEVTDAIDQGRSYNLGTAKDRGVFLGQATVPLVLPAIMAYEVTRDELFMNAITAACDYMLGGNPLDKVWITGLNAHSVTQIFHMDSWYRPDGNPLPVPGLIPYGPAFPGDWMKGPNGEDNNWGWWDNDYNLTTCYPHFRAWPVHELWFEQRYSPPSSEYTVHQTIAPAAAVYGYLTEEK